MTTAVDLLASYWTIAKGAQPHTDHEYSTADFKDRVEAIARAGFKGMGIWHADLSHTMEKYSLAEMKKILDDNGIKHLELEFLTDWFLDGERRARSNELRKMLLRAADVLKPRHIKVGDFFHEKCPMPKLIESFAGLCHDAAEHGTRILFELMPFAMIDTLEGALEMVSGAGARNGGIILDTWHVVKLGIPCEKLQQIPPQYLLGVELNDGTIRNTGDMVEETVNHRRLCGEGEFDVKGFIRAVQAAGYNGPWGIEVLNQEMRSWPLDKMVTEAYRTTSAQF